MSTKMERNIYLLRKGTYGSTHTLAPAGLF